MTARKPNSAAASVRGDVRENRRSASAAVLAMICVLLPAGAAGAEASQRDPYAAVVKANQAFAQAEYDQALEGYDAAVETLGESPELNYNRAAARYKLGEHETAADLFAQAALSDDPALRRRARFNWGNCDYATALQAMQPAPSEEGAQPDSQAAIEKLGSAIEHYRSALAIEGEHESRPAVEQAARGNIERAQRLIELIQEQQQQQQQQNQQCDNENQDQNDEQQDQQQQDQENEQQQDEQQQDQQQQDQQQQDQQDQSQEQQEEQNQQQQQTEQQQSDQQQPQPQQQEMTPEEIEAALQAVRDKEQQRREEKARKVRAVRVPVVRDW